MADAPDWNRSANPDELLVLVWPPQWGDPPPRPPAEFYRRRRLFEVACARQVWDLLSTDARSAVLISERFADGLATEADLLASAVPLDMGAVTFRQHARNAAGGASRGPHEGAHPGFYFPYRAGETARSSAKATATRAAGPALPNHSTAWHAAWTAAFGRARAEQAGLVRDIFPPPGTSPAAEPHWLTSTVVAMARQMYESRDFTPMPILADALQDAGCADELVLDHCRKPAPHVRGCWVVDLLR
jgi:hypothetical protein